MVGVAFGIFAFGIDSVDPPMYNLAHYGMRLSPGTDFDCSHCAPLWLAGFHAMTIFHAIKLKRRSALRAPGFNAMKIFPRLEKTLADAGEKLLPALNYGFGRAFDTSVLAIPALLKIALIVLSFRYLFEFAWTLWKPYWFLAVVVWSTAIILAIVFLISFQKALRDYWKDSAQKTDSVGLLPFLWWLALPVAIVVVATWSGYSFQTKLLGATQAAVRKILSWF